MNNYDKLVLFINPLVSEFINTAFCLYNFVKNKVTTWYIK